MTAFAGRKFPQRAYGGVWAGQLRWGPLTHHRVLQVLKNPAYAGAYVHGRVTTPHEGGRRWQRAHSLVPLRLARLPSQ